MKYQPERCSLSQRVIDSYSPSTKTTEKRGSIPDNCATSQSENAVVGGSDLE